MDLSLRGSQINLVARQKQKPKYSSQTNLHTNRPRSASFFSRRSRSSPFLRRPQSADPKFRRDCESSCSFSCTGGVYQGKLPKKEQNKYQSVSSSDLLKLLLDEPIKRSWLCRGQPAEGASSPDECSELCSARRYSSHTNLNKCTRSKTIGGNSIESDFNADKQLKSSVGQHYVRRPLTASQVYNQLTANKMSAASAGDKTSYGASAKTTTTDYWHSLTAAAKSKSKPDLPGRVSFSNPSAAQDLDSSDCDNDKQEQYQHFVSSKNKADCSISAPGPATVPDFVGSSSTVPPLTQSSDNNSGGLKKSVHFGGNGGSEVLAETYEYPKCPSDNCSCSTRSSSTASIHDVTDIKCACDSPTCKYTVGSEKESRVRELPALRTDIDANHAEKKSPVEDLPVIRDYKNTVGEQLANSVVKNLLDDATPQLSTLNNMEFSTYLGKYASSESHLSKQNNFSDATNANSKAQAYKTSSKRNLVSELLKTENNFEKTNLSKSAYSSSSESVIKNYLKVVASTSQVSNPKQLNKPSSADAITKSKKPKTLPAIKSVSQPQKAKKLSSSFSSLRDETNLNEFNLDKVDSWMSIHEQTMCRTAPPKECANYEDALERFTKDSNEGDEEPQDTASQVSTKSNESSQEDSTYDEIVSVIKEIDEDKKKDNFAEQSTKEMELELDESQQEELPETRVEKPVGAEQKSPDKYKDILNYLDNVEDSCDKTLLETRRSIPESNRTEIEFVVEPDIAEDVPKLSDLLMLPNHQLARRVIALSLRANELANAVHLSKEHVMKIRSEKQKSIRNEKANSATRMRDQKKHFETVVTRHQGFIEQLLKDKGSLCEKVAALTRRLESQNQSWEHKLETEVQRVKETTMAGEKIRRERWVRENTKKIKELTVRGLEMEINKMTCNHQREVTELKRAHQQQLLDAVEEARLKHEQIESTIRESCAQDRESIIEKERAAIRERFERQLEEEHKSFDEQKQKICEEFAHERERLQAELRDKEIEYQTKRQEMQRDKELELEETVAELQDKMSKQDEKYQNRINTIEKQFEADFEIWKREYENSLKMQQVEKENTIRQHYRAERDRQIDAIVTRMDAEALKNAEEFELKLNRQKEKYEKDLYEAESVEKSLREKFNETRNRLAESDAQVRNHQAELKQLQIELGHSKKMCNEFLAEREQLRENLRNDIQCEVATLKSERDNEIQKIHKRVQQAIEKKDATIELLQKENGALRERCIKLEAIIRQQRKDYCVK